MVRILSIMLRSIMIKASSQPLGSYLNAIISRAAVTEDGDQGLLLAP